MDELTTIDALVARGVTRVQHSGWGADGILGGYLRLTVEAGVVAPTGTLYIHGTREPQEFKVNSEVAFGFAPREEWREYTGPLDPRDT